MVLSEQVKDIFTLCFQAKPGVFAEITAMPADAARRAGLVKRDREEWIIAA